MNIILHIQFYDITQGPNDDYEPWTSYIQEVTEISNERVVAVSKQLYKKFVRVSKNELLKHHRKMSMMYYKF